VRAAHTPNGVRRRRRPAREGGTRGTGLRLWTASTVPCHSDQSTAHGPAVGGGPRRVRAMRAGRRAATASRVWARVGSV
jgi:hypothetical protein